MMKKIANNSFQGLLILLLVFGLFQVSRVNYLLFHTMAELFSITISSIIFVLAWNSRPYLKNNYLMILGLSGLFTAGFDMVHTIAYDGMGVFPGIGANLATQLWLASRYLQSLIFLIAPLFLHRRFHEKWVLAALTLVSTVLFLSIVSWRIFPTAYISGSGLTPFKIVSEYVIIAIFLLSIAGLYHFRAMFHPKVLNLLSGSIILGILAEAAFTSYIGVYDYANLIGHFLKIGSYYLIYKAIIETGFVRPYQTIFWELKQSEEALRSSQTHLEEQVLERTTELQIANTDLRGQIAARLTAEEALRKMNQELETRVAERTLELSKANQKLALELAERKRVDQALRVGQARLRRLVESNIIGVMFTRDDGSISNANDALLQMTGYCQEDLLAGSLNWIEMTPAEYKPLDKQGVSEVHQRGSCTPYEKEYIRKNGSRVPILIGYASLEDLPGEYICFVVDMTAQKTAEAALQHYAAQLERSNQELQEFAYVASHDLQEPLRKIIAFGDRLNSSARDKLDEQEHDYLTRMQNASVRMRNMINDLLALSRVTTKAQPFTPVDLNQVMKEVTSDLEVRIEQTGAVLTVEPLPLIDADALQMRLLLQNLVSNSLKFIQPGERPQIRVFTEVSPDGSSENEKVKIIVSDNGIGFDPQYRERIFQPFQRLHGMNAFEGSGMGLAIVQKIIQRHKGSITAFSSLGEGATFEVTLPLHQNGTSE